MRRMAADGKAAMAQALFIRKYRKHCFLREWCGSCRSVFGSCSVGTLHENTNKIETESGRTLSC